MSEVVHNEADEDLREQAEIGRAIATGFLFGVPVTFFVFAGILLVAGVGVPRSVGIAIWVALIGGGFYGGVAGLLRVLNKHGH